MVSALVTAPPPAAFPLSNTVLATVSAHIVALPLIVLGALVVSALVRAGVALSLRRRPQLRLVARPAVAMSRDAA
jgi:hypothetical protein